MLIMRLLSWKEAFTFLDIAKNFCKFIKDITISLNVTRIDFIFDSYLEQSIKSCERLRRRQSDCISYNSIHESVPLPIQPEKFWGSSENKIFIAEIYKNLHNKKF